MKPIIAICAAAALCGAIATVGWAQDASDNSGGSFGGSSSSTSDDASSDPSTQGDNYGYNSGFGDTKHYDACTADYAKYCGQEDQYGMRQCLIDHQFDFSGTCKALRKQQAEQSYDSTYGVTGTHTDDPVNWDVKTQYSGE